VKLSLSKKKISTTMLISMTDVIFLLIIFLLIVSNFSSQTGLPVRLPGSHTATRHTLQSLSITFYADGRLFYNEAEISMEELPDSLKRDFVDIEQVVRISAEDIIPLQQIINLMDSIRSAGYQKIFVATGVEEQ
jgi:biopolymer transport protein ExbD